MARRGMSVTYQKLINLLFKTFFEELNKLTKEKRFYRTKLVNVHLYFMGMSNLKISVADHCHQHRSPYDQDRYPYDQDRFPYYQLLAL